MARAALFQKDTPKSERVFYYDNEEDDPIQTKEQEQKEEVGLPEGYKFIPTGIWTRIFGEIIFRGFWIFGHWYELSYWKMKVHGREKLKAVKGKGFLLYANHTNPFHDVFGPAVAIRRKNYTVISPVNLKLPKIGWTLPYIGGLPLGKTAEEKQAFNAAVDERLRQGKCVVIYPEAHVWPFHTGIRKFPAGGRNFKYATRNNTPVYTMTTTYHKRKGRELPRIEVYLDGPFMPDEKLSEEKKREKLAQQVYDSMMKNSRHSTYEYFEYKKKGNK